MNDLQYSYLLMDTGYLLVWLTIYVYRQDLRSLLVASSVPLGFVGLALNFAYIRDWWYPRTLTGTIPAVENLLYGFGMGVSAAIAHAILGTTPTFKISPGRRPLRRKLLYAAAFPSGVAIFCVLHFALGVHTIHTSLLMLAAGLLIILFHRPDLALHAAASAAVFTLVSSLIYATVSGITPGWIGLFWYFDLFPRTIVLAMPLEDVLFYALFGACFGTHFHAWFGGRVTRRDLWTAAAGIELIRREQVPEGVPPHTRSGDRRCQPGRPTCGAAVDP